MNPTLLKQQQTVPPIKINLNLTIKQSIAWEYLTDSETNELLFGGAGGGGKSMLGCAWSIYLCLKYAGIRGAIGREELKSLKESTLLTFFEVCRRWGLREGQHYKYNQNEGTITFRNGSVIYLKELKFYPSDPDYDYLGSTEYTFSFIDEASQVTQKAKNVLRSRIRYRLKEFGLIPKQFETCNPHKGYLYKEFYKPFKDGSLPKHLKFVQALPGDNPFLDESYIENLKSLDKQTKERLLYGNWEYDDDPTVLMEYDAITDLFTNNVVKDDKEYITVDVARFGDDRTVIGYWRGWECVRVAAFKKMPIVTDPNHPEIKSIESVVQEWRENYKVPLSRTLVDEDGVGGGLKDRLGCKGFQGGRKPFKGQNYLNLRAQCYYFLAHKVNRREIAVRTQNPQIQALLSEELEQIKAWNRDKDSKVQVIPKDKIKESLGRSPDFSDMLMMRCYFVFLPVPHVQVVNY